MLNCSSRKLAILFLEKGSKGSRARVGVQLYPQISLLLRFVVIKFRHHRQGYRLGFSSKTDVVRCGLEQNTSIAVESSGEHLEKRNQ